LTVDRMKHFLWRYHDPEDPTYPGPTPHAGAIDRMYGLIDCIVGEFAALGDVMVISDHGHARRCTRMLYVDEVLRRAGLINGAGRFSKARLLERVKRLVLRTSYTLAVEEQLYSVARRLPNRQALKYSSFSDSGTGKRTGLSKTFGRNQHSGVELATDDPATRDHVIHALERVRDPDTDETVMEWVRSREEVVEGAMMSRYPEVLFKLREGYGVDFGMYGSLFSPDVNHRRISGGHRPTGVYGSTVPTDAPASIEGVHDHILRRLANANPARE